MTSWLPFDGPLHWALVAVLFVAVFVCMVMSALHKHPLPPMPLRHIALSPRAVPEVALAAFRSRGLADVGFRSLGVLTLWQQTSRYTFAEVWVDTATSTTVGQTFFVQHKPDSTPLIATCIFSCLGDPAAPSVVGVSSSGVSVTSGTKPGDEELFLPGLSPAQMYQLHRLQLARRSDDGARLGCASVEQAVAILDWLGERGLRWRLDSGRLERGADGELRLSWSQCAWWVAGSLPPGRWIRPLYRQWVGRRAAATLRRSLPGPVPAQFTLSSAAPAGRVPPPPPPSALPPPPPALAR